MKNMLLTCLLLILLTDKARAQDTDVLESDARNIASAFVGAAHYVVGRVGIECLGLLGRLETPREYVNIWQERNAKYYQASTKYVVKKMEAAFASGGNVAKNAVLKEYSSIVRKEAEGTLADWIGQGNKKDGCQRAVMMIDRGILDVTPEVPIYQDLQSLVDWSAIN